jgi:hypothetical protein
MLLNIVGCWLLLVAVAAAASPSGIFEEFLKNFNKENGKKKCRNFWRHAFSDRDRP